MNKYVAMWWNDFHPFDNIALARKHYPALHYSAIGDTEINEMFNKEMKK